MKLNRAFDFLARLHRGQTGVSLVLIAITLTVLFGMTAMVVDIGTVAYNKRLAQNLVDAAVLAGVQELPEDRIVAENVARSYGELNGEEDDQLRFEFPNDFTIYAEVTRTVSFTFARVIGITESEITAVAVAEVGSPQALGGLLPFGIECLDEPPEFNCGFNLYDPVELKVEDRDSPGEWHGVRLDIDDPGGSNYRPNIKYGSDTIIKIGDQLVPEGGRKVGPTEKGIEYRLELPGAEITLENWLASQGTDEPLFSPRVVVIPFVTDFGNGARDRVTVVRFGRFWLDGSGPLGAVLGRFIDGFSSLDGVFGAYDPGSAIKIIHLTL